MSSRDHYGGPPSRDGTLHDPERDATTLPLIREAVRRDMPVLAICRGIQELNVALGGTLHQRIHELPGGAQSPRSRRTHRNDRWTSAMAPRTRVSLTPGRRFSPRSPVPTEIMVNSLHGQGIDQPAPRLMVEAMAPDGQIEAVSLPARDLSSAYSGTPSTSRWRTRSRGRCLPRFARGLPRSRARFRKTPRRKIVAPL